MDTWQEFWGTTNDEPFYDMFANAGEENNAFFFGGPVRILVFFPQERSSASKNAFVLTALLERYNQFEARTRRSSSLCTGL